MSADVHSLHLTNAEFADLLAGEPASAAAEAHLLVCTFCREELAAVTTSMGSFRDFGTSWAQTRSVARVPVPSRWTLRLSSLPSWQAGLAAMAFSGVVAFHLAAPHPPTRVASGPGTPAVAASAPSRAELADDNRLMLSINQELSYRAPVAVAADDTGSAAHTAGHRAADTVEN